MSVDVGDGLARKIISDYALIVYPLSAGIALILAGILFDNQGMGAEAGVAAATGIIISGIAVVAYVIFWALGQRGV